MYYEDGPVEDLIAIIRDFSDRNSYTDPTLGAAISLLGRFTLLESSFFRQICRLLHSFRQHENNRKNMEILRDFSLKYIFEGSSSMPT